MTGDMLLSPKLLLAALFIIWAHVTTAEGCSLGNYVECNEPIEELYKNKGWLEQDVSDIRGNEKDKDELCKVLQGYMSCVEGFINKCPDHLKDQYDRMKKLMKRTDCSYNSGTPGYLVAILMGVSVLLIALAGIGCYILHEKLCKRYH